MPPKRVSNGGNDPDQAEKFTRYVRQKLQSYTRTGQACDRCKVRKIRCDGLPEGCSPCRNTNTECRTTDRISQRAMPRGYVEGLESKCAQLEAKLRQMEEQLKARRTDGSQYSSPNPQLESDIPVYESTGYDRHTPDDTNLGGVTNSANVGTGVSRGDDKPDNSNSPATFRAGNSDNYLGLSAGSSVINAMKACGVSVLGVYINLKDLDPSEPETARLPNSSLPATSYESFLKSVYGGESSRIEKPSTPSKEEMDEILSWYFNMSYPYIPVLHKPTIIAMVDRFYSDPGFEDQMTPAEKVIFYMIIAIQYYSTAVRLRMDPSKNSATVERMKKSHLYYHYALSFLQYLVSNRALEDVQGLCLVLQHMRSFPKPGGAWLLARLAISIMLEIGMHRSAKKWLVEKLGNNPIKLEMRKRVFHSILCIESSLASKLGRPFSLKPSDYDIEIPLGVDDEFLTEKGILPVPPGREGCTFQVALEMFRITPVYIDVMSTLYGVHRPSPERYIKVVNSLEKKLDEWYNRLPPHLRVDNMDFDSISPNDNSRLTFQKFQACFLMTWMHECRVLMRHRCLGFANSVSAEFNKESEEICLHSSRIILRITDALHKKADHVDTTWYSVTTIFLATLTILFSLDSKKDMDPREVEQLKRDMKSSADIIQSIGRILESGDYLSKKIRQLTEYSLKKITENQLPKVAPHSMPNGVQTMALHPPLVVPPHVQPIYTPNLSAPPEPFHLPATSHSYPQMSTSVYSPVEQPLTSASYGPQVYQTEITHQFYPGYQEPQWMGQYRGDEEWRMYGASLHNVLVDHPNHSVQSGATTLLNIHKAYPQETTRSMPSQQSGNYQTGDAVTWVGPLSTNAYGYPEVSAHSGNGN